MLSRLNLSRSHLLLIVVASVVLLAIVLFALAPGLIDRAVRRQLANEGIDAHYELRKLTVFSTLVEQAHVTLGAMDIGIDTIDAIYSPLHLLQNRKVDAVSIAGLDVEVRLTELELPASSGDTIPVIPDILSNIPVEQLLISSGKLLLKGAHGQKRDYLLEGMFSNIGERLDLAVNLEGTAGIEALLLSLSENGDKGELRAKGDIDNLDGWLQLVMSASSVQPPGHISLSRGRGEFDLFAEASARLLSRWAGTLTLQDLQLTFDDLIIPIQRMVLGATGNADALATASLAGRFASVEWRDLRTGPFTLYATAHSLASVTAEVESLSLDYHRLPLEFAGLAAEVVRHEEGSFTAQGSGMISNWSLPFRLSYRQLTTGTATVILTIPKSQVQAILPHGALPPITYPIEVKGGLASKAELQLAKDNGGARLDGSLRATALSLKSQEFNVEGLSSAVAFAVSADRKRFSTDLLTAEAITIAGLSVRNIRLAVQAAYPGEVLIRDFKLNGFGGELDIPQLELSIPAAGTPVLNQPARIAFSAFDLSEVAKQFLQNWNLGGRLSIQAAIAPEPPGYRIASEVQLVSGPLSLRSPQGISAVLENLLLNVDADTAAVEVSTRQPLYLTSLSSGSISFSGRTSFSGAVTLYPESLPEQISVNGEVEITLSDERIDISDTASIEGISANAQVTFGGDQLLESLQTDKLQIRRIQVGELAATDFVAAHLDVAPETVRAGPITAKFLGGTLSISDVSGGFDDLAFTLSFTRINSSQLTEKIPQFEGQLSGPFNGYLRLKRIEGGVAIVGGELRLPQGETGRLIYPALADLIGTDDTMVMRNIRRSLEDLRLTAFHLRLDPKAEDGVPARLTIKGSGVQKNAPPVDLDLKLQGDVGETLKLVVDALLGDGFNVTFGLPKGDGA